MNTETISAALSELVKLLLSPASVGIPSFSIQGPVIVVFPTIIVLVALLVIAFIRFYKHETNK